MKGCWASARPPGGKLLNRPHPRVKWRVRETWEPGPQPPRVTATHSSDGSVPPFRTSCSTCLLFSASRSPNLAQDSHPPALASYGLPSGHLPGISQQHFLLPSSKRPSLMVIQESLCRFPGRWKPIRSRGRNQLQRPGPW